MKGGVMEGKKVGDIETSEALRGGLRRMSGPKQNVRKHRDCGDTVTEFTVTLQ